MKKIDIKKHQLVPEHEKLSEKEKQALLEKYDVSFDELPKIAKNDPAIEGLDAKPGDVVKITRPSKTSGEADFFRGVTNA